MATTTTTGKYLLIELIRDHHQFNLPVIPKGTVCKVLGGRKLDNGKREYAVLFPYSVSPSEPRVFKEGHVRVVLRENTRVIGRTD